MALTLIRKQSAPAATTPDTLYTVPAATNTVLSSIIICNRGVGGTYRLALRALGAVLANSHYIVYDAAISANETVIIQSGQVCIATDIVEVYASHANMTFQLSGEENS